MNREGVWRVWCLDSKHLQAFSNLFSSVKHSELLTEGSMIIRDGQSCLNLLKGQVCLSTRASLTQIVLF